MQLIFHVKKIIIINIDLGPNNKCNIQTEPLGFKVFDILPSFCFGADSAGKWCNKFPHIIGL